MQFDAAYGVLVRDRGTPPSLFYPLVSISALLGLEPSLRGLTVSDKLALPGEEVDDLRGALVRKGWSGNATIARNRG